MSPTQIKICANVMHAVHNVECIKLGNQVGCVMTDEIVEIRWKTKSKASSTECQQCCSLFLLCRAYGLLEWVISLSIDTELIYTHCKCKNVHCTLRSNVQDTSTYLPYSRNHKLIILLQLAVLRVLLQTLKLTKFDNLITILSIKTLFDSRRQVYF